MSPTRRTTLALLILTVVVTCGFLARWQYRRHLDRQAANSLLLAAAELPPIELSAATTDGVSLAGRRLLVKGRFDPAGELLLRGRVHRAAPGLEVVTPLIVDGEPVIVWVLRGFVAAPDATTPAGAVPPPDTGSVRLTGLGLAIPATEDAGQPLVRGADTTWRRLDSAFLATRRPGSLPVYLLLDVDSDGPGGLPVVPPPSLDSGPHFSYAVQWIGIGLAALAFGIIALRPRAGRAQSPPHAAP
ncbi:MAG: SURF1 family protein [Gemmatimonadales bacterium]|nr:SURF1 family protein [Gemmatimonadales bacterium]